MTAIASHSSIMTSFIKVEPHSYHPYTTKVKDSLQSAPEHEMSIFPLAMWGQGEYQVFARFSLKYGVIIDVYKNNVQIKKKAHLTLPREITHEKLGHWQVELAKQKIKIVEDQGAITITLDKSDEVNLPPATKDLAKLVKEGLNQELETLALACIDTFSGGLEELVELSELAPVVTKAVFTKLNSLNMSDKNVIDAVANALSLCEPPPVEYVNAILKSIYDIIGQTNRMDCLDNIAAVLCALNLEGEQPSVTKGLKAKLLLLKQHQQKTISNSAQQCENALLKKSKMKKVAPFANSQPTRHLLDRAPQTLRWNLHLYRIERESQISQKEIFVPRKEIENINSFISSDSKVCYLVGVCGSGRSTLLEKAESELFQKGYTPLLPQALQHFSKEHIEQLKQNQKVVFLAKDGIIEEGWSHAKWIITRDKRTFSTDENATVIYLSSFSKDQIDSYLKEIQIVDWSVERYSQAISQMQITLDTPLLLKMAIEIIPYNHPSITTNYELYHAFIEHWFVNQCQQRLLSGNSTPTKEAFLDYCTCLAKTMSAANLEQIPKKAIQSLPWSTFFSSEKSTLMETSLLIETSNGWRFWHPVLQAYFTEQKRGSPILHAPLDVCSTKELTLHLQSETIRSYEKTALEQLASSCLTRFKEREITREALEEVMPLATCSQKQLVEILRSKLCPSLQLHVIELIVIALVDLKVEIPEAEVDQVLSSIKSNKSAVNTYIKQALYRLTKTQKSAKKQEAFLQVQEARKQIALGETVTCKPEVLFAQVIVIRELDRAICQANDATLIKQWSDTRAALAKLVKKPLAQEKQVDAPVHASLLSLAKTELQWHMTKMQVAAIDDPLVVEQKKLNFPLTAACHKRVAEEDCFSLDDHVNNFLTKNKQRILLITGELGSGKTFFLKMLNASRWEKGTHTLYISLEGISKTSTTIVEDALKERGFGEKQITEFKATSPLLLIDGYEQMEGEEQSNLIASNALLDWGGKVIITCNLTYAQRLGHYQRFFTPKADAAKLFDEVTLMPLSYKQVDSYFSKYIDRKWTKVFYLNVIARHPNMQEMAKNPQLLHKLAQILPKKIENPSDESDQQLSLTPGELLEIEGPIGKINKALYVNDVRLMPFWIEKAKRSESLRGELLQIIEGSKTDLQKQVAAANAITILVAAGHSFANADLDGVRIPGARLDGGNFSQAKLERSDLSFASMRHIFAANASISNGHLSGVCFGRKPALLDHLSEVATVAWSPKGDKIISAGKGETIFIWNVQAEQKPLRVEGHMNEIVALTFSPSGETFASASLDGSIRLWSIDGKQTGMIHHPTTHLAFSPTGKTLAGVSIDGKVYMWDLQGELITTLTPSEGVFTTAIFSPDGKIIVTGNEHRSIQLWSIEGTLLDKAVGHTEKVTALAFCPSGKKIASASADKTIHIWSFNQNVCRSLFQLKGHQGDVNTLAFSHDGITLASGGADHQIYLWNAKQSGKPFASFRHKEAVSSIAFSPDSALLVSGSSDKSVRIWKNEQTPLPTFQEQTDALAFSLDGAKLASGDQSGSLNVWSAQKGELLVHFEHDDQAVHTVTFNCNGTQLASGGESAIVRIWDLASKTLRLTLEGHRARINAIAFSPDGQQLASGSNDMTIRLYSINKNGELLVQFTDDKPVTHLAFHPDQLYITSVNEHLLHFWDLKTLERTHLTYTGYYFPNWPINATKHKNEIKVVGVYPDGKKVTSVSHDLLRIIDTETENHSYTTMSASGVITMSSDCMRIAIGPKCVTIIDQLETGNTCFNAHVGTITSMALSPNQSVIAVAGDDQSIKVWRINEKKHVTLMWRTDTDLVMHHLCIQNTHGLSRSNAKLLTQMGSLGESSSAHIS